MTTPLDPNQPLPPPDRLDAPVPATPPRPGPQQSAAPQQSASFSGALGGSLALRVAIVAAAAIVLLVSAALTFAASPAPSGGATDNATPQGNASAPRAGGLGGILGRLDGLRDRAGFGRVTITAIDGSNISLKTEDGWTRTITVTNATTITKGGQTIALGDLKVGDQIRFRQTRNADGTFTIQAINVVLPSVAGEVTAVNGNTFTVKTRANVSWTITTNDATKYMLDGGTGAKSDIKVGAKVGVVGTQSGESALTATTVHIAAAAVAGRVTAKTADTITIERIGGGTATIHVSGSTTYRVPGKDNASLSDIQVGAMVVAAGRQRSDGSLDAVAVRAGGKLGRGLGNGRLPKLGPNATPNATPGSYSAG